MLPSDALVHPRTVQLILCYQLQQFAEQVPACAIQLSIVPVLPACALPTTSFLTQLFAATAHKACAMPLSSAQAPPDHAPSTLCIPTGLSVELQQDHAMLLSCAMACPLLAPSTNCFQTAPCVAHLLEHATFLKSAAEHHPNVRMTLFSQAQLFADRVPVFATKLKCALGRAAYARLTSFNHLHSSAAPAPTPATHPRTAPEKQ